MSDYQEKKILLPNHQKSRLSQEKILPQIKTITRKNPLKCQTITRKNPLKCQTIKEKNPLKKSEYQAEKILSKCQTIKKKNPGYLKIPDIWIV